jgi:hypothetical protein
MIRKFILHFLLMILGLLTCRAVTIYSVDIDTTAWSGLSGTLAFDLIGGDATATNNTATIGSFATNGALGSTDSFTLTDAAFFNEVLRGITFGTHLSFTLQLTENHTAPGFDQFSFFLLDPSSLLPLGPTTDPTEANALFAIDLTGAPGGNAMVFASTVPGISWTLTNQNADSVPDTGSPFGLAACGIASLALFRFAFRARPHRA